MRLQRITAAGGVTFGKTMSDNCEIIKVVPEILTSTVSGMPGVLVTTPKEFCHNETGWMPQYKILVAYDVPWHGVRLSSNFQSLPSFNSDAVLSETMAYSGANGGAWRKPTAVIQGRIFKFGMRWDF